MFQVKGTLIADSMSIFLMCHIINPELFHLRKEVQDSDLAHFWSNFLSFESFDVWSLSLASIWAGIILRFLAVLCSKMEDLLISRLFMTKNAIYPCQIYALDSSLIWRCQISNILFWFFQVHLYLKFDMIESMSYQGHHIWNSPHQKN